MKFSLVYPTRDRPKFVEKALRFLSYSQASDVQIVICDNPSSEDLNVESICRESGLRNITYARAPHDFSMTDNWNYALTLAMGSYVGYFTDKMFLLPGTLPAVRALLLTQSPDIISWTDATYHPLAYSDYFGPGVYKTRVYKSDAYAIAFDAQADLRRRLSAKETRESMSSRDYASGKICFGLYSRELIDSIRDHAAEVFLPISPDYTSMAMGLALARTAVFLNADGIVHIHTDLSNGGRFEREADYAAAFLTSVDPENTRWGFQLVPKLDWSVENNLYGDYSRALQAVGDKILINSMSDRNWFEHITAKVRNHPAGTGVPNPQPAGPLQEFALQRGWQGEVVAFTPKFSKSVGRRLPIVSMRTLRRWLRAVLPANVVAVLVVVVGRWSQPEVDVVKKVTVMDDLSQILP